VPLAVAPENFAEVVRGLAKAGFAGANVTIPHKEAAFAACDVVEDFARRAGAVNTLVFSANGIEGRNTDGYGFVANLRAHGGNPAAGPALILGAGGAARAIAAALQDAGAAVTICNRSPERAAALAAALPPAQVLPWADRAAALGEFSLLVNTTSLGMVHNPALEMSLAKAGPGLAVADIVYAPLVTPLLADAAARGLKPVEGLGMLLHQAVPGFAAWFGVTPVVDEELYRIVAS
jgi:shikimate dehydrogenase